MVAASLSGTVCLQRVIWPYYADGARNLAMGNGPPMFLLSNENIIQLRRYCDGNGVFLSGDQLQHPIQGD